MESGRSLLRAWMGRMRLNQRDSAVYIGIHEAELSQYLSRSRTPGLERAILIERKTGIPVEAWSSEVNRTESVEHPNSGSGALSRA